MKKVNVTIKYMIEDTTIKSIMVIPFSKEICTYYINEGKRHAVTYEKMIELLTGLVPSLTIKIHEKLIKKLSFYIDVLELELFELKSNAEITNKNNIQLELKKLKQSNYSRPDYQDQVEKLIEKTIKRS